MHKISPPRLSSPRALRTSSRAAALLLAVVWAGSPVTSAWAGPDGKEVLDAKQVVAPCEELVRMIRARVQAEPLKANELVVAHMRAHEDCACEIARAAIEALSFQRVVSPKEVVIANDAQVDANRVAGVLRASLLTIYQHIPEARDCVRDLVLAAVDAVGGDARAVAQVMGAALPIVVAYEPALVEPLVQAVNRQVPAAAGLIAEIRANLLLPSVVLSPGRLRLENQVIEPNFSTLLPPNSPNRDLNDMITNNRNVVEDPEATSF